MDHWQPELADQHFVRRHRRGSRDDRPFNPYIRMGVLKVSLAISLVINGILLALLLSR